MKTWTRAAAAVAMAGGMMFATAGGALAQGGDNENCVSDQVVGESVMGPITDIAPTEHATVENIYDGSLSHWKDGARITSLYPDQGVREIWEERWHTLPSGGISRYHQLVECEEIEPPAPQGLGTGGADLIRSGFGSGAGWITYYVVSGTVTVGDPDPVPPPPSEEP